jgi:hypothetical protein
MFNFLYTLILQIVVVQSITISFTKYLYKKYSAEIRLLCDRICLNQEYNDIDFVEWQKSIEITGFSIEIIYMTIREMKPKHLLEIGTSYGLITRSILLALEKNRKEGHQGHLVSIDSKNQFYLGREHERENAVMEFDKSNDPDSWTQRYNLVREGNVNILNARMIPGLGGLLLYMIGDLKDMIRGFEIQLKSFDFIIFSKKFSPFFMEWVHEQLIQNQLSHRGKHLSALQIYYFGSVRLSGGTTTFNTTSFEDRHKRMVESMPFSTTKPVEIDVFTHEVVSIISEFYPLQPLKC